MIARLPFQAAERGRTVGDLGLPDGYTVVRSCENLPCMSTDFVVHHPSFAECPEGSLLPAWREDPAPAQAEPDARLRSTLFRYLAQHQGEVGRRRLIELPCDCAICEEARSALGMPTVRGIPG